MDRWSLKLVYVKQSRNLKNFINTVYLIFLIELLSKSSSSNNCFAATCSQSLGGCNMHFFISLYLQIPAKERSIISMTCNVDRVDGTPHVNFISIFMISMLLLILTQWYREMHPAIKDKIDWVESHLQYNTSWFDSSVTRAIIINQTTERCLFICN